jgi:hypothetical protein
MERQAAAVMYFFPHLTNVHIKCHRNDEWTTDSLQLIGAGILGDVRPCHISAGNLQLFAEVTGRSGIESDTPLIIFPSPLFLKATPELKPIHTQSDTSKLDDLITAVSEHQVETNVQSLVTVIPIQPATNAQFHWTMPITISTPLILLVVVVYYCLHTHGVSLANCKTRSTSTATTVDTTDTVADRPIAASRHADIPAVRYSAYAMEGHSTE